MDASGLTFAAAPPRNDPAASRRGQPLPERDAAGGGGDSGSAPGPAGGAGEGGVGGRTASMGGTRDGVLGGGAGLEADLANLGKKKKDAAAPPVASGKGAGLENTNEKNRWPFSGTSRSGGRPAGAGAGSRGSSSTPPTPTPPVGGGGAPTFRGGGPVAATRGEPSSAMPASGGRKGARGSGSAEKGETVERDGGRLRDSSGTTGGREEQQPKPDVARRRGWGRNGGRGGVPSGSGGGDGGSPQGAGIPDATAAAAAAATAGRGGADRVGSAAIDSKSSPEDILASMGLKSGVSLGPDGVGRGPAAFRTPEEIMAESNGGRAGGKKTNEGGKTGLFGRLWNKKGKQ